MAGSASCPWTTILVMCWKEEGAVVVTLVLVLALAWALALVSHFKVLRQCFLYVMDNVLSGKLSCMQTGLVSCG